MWIIYVKKGSGYIKPLPFHMLRRIGLKLGRDLRNRNSS